MAKSFDQELFERLRAGGLRKRVANVLSEAEAAGRGAGGRAEQTVRTTIADLRRLADELEDRFRGATGGTTKRSAAAQKAAATRKRKATQRSTAAKKAAATRAKSSGSRSGSGSRTTSRSSSNGRTSSRSRSGTSRSRSTARSGSRS